MHDTHSRGQLEHELEHELGHKLEHQLKHQLKAQKLQEAIRHYEGLRPRNSGDGVSSSGCQAVDCLLPEGGLRSGMLVEWLSLVPGSAAGLIGLVNCREACKQGGMLVVIDRRQSFYPPVAVAWGIDPRQMIVIHPAQQAEHVWALVQALESPAVAAVWSVVESIDAKSYQRVHLAAQTGGTLGVLLRPAAARGQPSWADVQFWVKPALQDSLRQVEVRLARCRGAKAGGKAVLEIDTTHGLLRETTSPETKSETKPETKPETAHPLHLATELAHPKNPPSRTGT